MLPTSSPPATLTALRIGTSTDKAPLDRARPLSTGQLVARLRAARQAADETKSALLVWLLSGVAEPRQKQLLDSLPAKLLGGDLRWLRLQGNRWALLVTNLACDDLDTVCELVSAAIPGESSWAVFAYPTDWYLLHNEPQGSYKLSATLGPDYLTRCVADPKVRRAGLEFTGRPYLCLEPAFFMPTPVWKRVIDMLASAAALIALTPLFLLLAGIIKSGSQGPLLFWQARHGGTGRKFWMCKFRTMRVDFDAQQQVLHLRSLLESGKPLKKIDAAQAMIPHAKWIRAAGLDELPQLWNVLRGEMSLVGPRPDVIAMEHYSRRQRRRFDVVPGLTGLWQINGKNRTTFEQMMEYDIQYIETRSLCNDIKIVLKTIPAVVRVAVD